MKAPRLETRRQLWFTDPSKAIPVAVVPAALAVYSNTFFNPFIFDDLEAIVANPDIQNLAEIGDVLGGSAQTPLGGRPVVALTLAVNYALAGADVTGYHAVNLLVHVLNGLLVFGILRRSSVAPWIAGAVALIWVVHPLNSEAVGYVVQRTELLVALFFLLTLYCTIRGWYAAAVASCLLGMGSKEVMAGAPIAVLVYDGTFLSRSFGEALRERRRLYLGLASTWLVLALLVASGPRAESVRFDADVTAGTYLTTQATVIVHYLRLSVWPDPLVVDYFDWPVASGLADVLPAAILVCTLLGLTAWAVYRRIAAGMLGAWFFLILAPTSSVVPIVTELAAERRMYLPLIAVITFILVAAHRALRTATLPLACAVGLVFGFMTIQRNMDYRTETAIWSDAVGTRPGNARAHNNLATAWLKEGHAEEAIRHLTEAIRLQPGYADARHNLGFTYHVLGRHHEAIRELEIALALDRTLAQARYFLAAAYLALGDRASALEQESMLRALDPPLAEALRKRIAEAGG